MEEMLDNVFKWYREHSEPNEKYRYSRCPVCLQAWWDDKEIHGQDCWIPEFKEARLQNQASAQQAAIQNGGKQ